MTFTSPKTGEPVRRALADSAHPCRFARPPPVLGDLGGGDVRPDGPHARSRRRLLLRLRGNAGAFSRQPDGQKFADNVVAFYEFMRDNYIYASYAIVPPQIDRSKPAHKQSDPTLYAGVVKERDDGIVISGAQQLATGGPLSDYIHLSCIHPLQPGDENYANCLAVPVAAEGVKLYPRRPFARAGSAFDYPLSSRFDESDSYVIFDNVFVPWERVFIYRNVELSRDQWWKTPSHLLRQPSGAGALRHQAALHGGAGATHERNDRQRRAAAGADHDGRARRPGVGLRIHAARARDRGADRERRAVAVEDRALFGDGAAIGAQRPHARNHPRACRARLSSRCRRRRPISAIRKSQPTSSATCARPRPTPRRASS